MTSAPVKTQSTAAGVRRLAFGSWLRWPVAVGLLAFIFHRNSGDFLFLKNCLSAWPWLLAAGALRTASLIVSSYRWYLLMTRHNISFSLRDALRLGCIGNLSNYVAPGTLGGDMARVAMIAADNDTHRKGAATMVLFDRMLGLLSLVIVGAVAGLTQWSRYDHPAVRTAIMVMGVAAVMGLTGVALAGVISRSFGALFGRLERFGGRVQTIAGMLREMVLLSGSNRPAVVLAIVLGLGGHLLNVSAVFCCSLAISRYAPLVSYEDHLALIPASEVTASLLPVPGGIGAREGAVRYLFARSAIPDLRVAAASAGFHAALAFSATSIVVAMVCGLAGFVTASTSVIERKRSAQRGGVLDANRSEPELVT